MVAQKKSLDFEELLNRIEKSPREACTRAIGTENSYLLEPYRGETAQAAIADKRQRRRRSDFFGLH